MVKKVRKYNIYVIILHLLICHYHHLIQLITSETADQGGKCQMLHLMQKYLQASWLSLACLGCKKKNNIFLLFIPESQSLPSNIALTRN